MIFFFVFFFSRVGPVCCHAGRAGARPHPEETECSLELSNLPTRGNALRTPFAVGAEYRVGREAPTGCTLTRRIAHPSDPAVWDSLSPNPRKHRHQGVEPQPRVEGKGPPPKGGSIPTKTPRDRIPDLRRRLAVAGNVPSTCRGCACKRGPGMFNVPIAAENSRDCQGRSPLGP